MWVSANKSQVDRANMRRVFYAATVGGVLLLLYSCATSREPPLQRMDPCSSEIPKDLSDAVRQLECQIPPEQQADIKRLCEKEFVAAVHMGLGMAIRNEWGLWKGSRLAEYFREMGVRHPDDMSGIVMSAFWHKIKGVDFDLDARVRCGRAWEEESRRLMAKVKPRRGAVIPLPKFSCIDDRSVIESREHWEKSR